MTPDPSIEDAIQRVREHVLHMKAERAISVTDCYDQVDQTIGQIVGAPSNEDACLYWADIGAAAVLAIAHTTHHPIRNAKGSE